MQDMTKRVIDAVRHISDLPAAGRYFGERKDTLSILLAPYFVWRLTTNNGLAILRKQHP